MVRSHRRVSVGASRNPVWVVTNKCKCLIWALWKEATSLIRLWFYKFLYDHLLRIGYGLECVFLPIHIHVFIFMGEFLVVGRVYRSCDCSHGRVTSLGRLDHFSHGKFGDVWESRSILLVLHARHCVWFFFIEELTWRVTVIWQCCYWFCILECTTCWVRTVSCSYLDYVCFDSPLMDTRSLKIRFL